MEGVGGRAGKGCEGWRPSRSPTLEGSDSPRASRIGKLFPSTSFSHRSRLNHCMKLQNVMVYNKLQPYFWSVKMMPLRIMYRIVQIVFLTLVIMYFNKIVKCQVQSEKIPIGKFLYKLSHSNGFIWNYLLWMNSFK